MSLHIKIRCDFCGEFLDYALAINEENILKEIGRLRRIAGADGWGYRNYRYYCPKCAKERECPQLKSEG